MIRKPEKLLSSNDVADIWLLITAGLMLNTKKK